MPRLYVLCWAAGLCAALPAFLLLATDRFTLLARLCAWAGLGLSLLPAVVMLGRPRSRMNSVAVTGLALTTYYYLAVFHETRLVLRWGEARISAQSVELSQLLAALAVPAMWAGWGLCGLLPVWRGLLRPRLHVHPRVLARAGTVIVLWSLFVAALFLRGDIATTSPQLLSVLGVLTPTELGFAMLLVPHLLGQGTARGRLLYAGLWLLALGLGLVAGVVMGILRPLLVLLLGQLLWRRRVPIAPVVAVGLVILLLQPVKGQYRQLVWDKRGPIEMGLCDRALLFLDLLQRHWLPGDPDGPGGPAGQDRAADTDASLRTAAARTGSALSLAHVIEMTPGAVPYQQGRTLRYLLYALVPRVLYPDKPSAQSADIWYAVAYGFLPKDQTAHVIVGLPQVAEGYINFGFPGGLLLLLGVGMLYRCVDEVFAHPIQPLQVYEGGEDRHQRRPEPRADLYLLRRAAEPHHAHGRQASDAVDERLFQVPAQPCRRHRPVRGALQLREGA